LHSIVIGRFLPDPIHRFGPRGRGCHQYGQHGLDSYGYGVGVVYDNPGVVIILRRVGAAQKRPFGVDALFHYRGGDVGVVVGVRLFIVVWRGQPLPRRLGQGVRRWSGRQFDGGWLGRGDSGVSLYGISDDIFHHHTGVNGGGICRANEVFGDGFVYDALGAFGLCAGLPLGLGWQRLHAGVGHEGLGRWHCGAYHGRYRCVGDLHHGGAAQRGTGRPSSSHTICLCA